MNEATFAELAAGYALNALGPEDDRAFVQALAAHPEWAHHLAADEATVAALSDTVAPIAPPAGIRAGLLAMIAADAETPVEPSPPLSASSSTEDPVAVAPLSRAKTRAAVPAAKRSWGPRAWFALAASVALLLGVGGGALVVAQQFTQPPAVVALDRIEGAPDAQSASTTLDDGTEATLHWSESIGEAVLVADGLPTLDADRTYELWYVRDGAPISAGIFAAEDDGDTTALLAGAMVPGDTIAVTVEPAGGSPTGGPTSDPVLAISTV